MPKAVIEKCYVNGGLHSGIFWTRANDPAPQGQESFASGQAVGFLTQILLAENAHRAVRATRLIILVKDDYELVRVDPDDLRASFGL